MPDKRLIDANALETEIIKEYFTKDNPSGMLTKKGEEISMRRLTLPDAGCEMRKASTLCLWCGAGSASTALLGL